LSCDDWQLQSGKQNSPCSNFSSTFSKDGWQPLVAPGVLLKSQHRLLRVRKEEATGLSRLYTELGEGITLLERGVAT